MENIYTTFEADIAYNVVSSPELDGVLTINIHGDFPELENLNTIYGASANTFYSNGIWIGYLTALEGGTQYQIIFSQDTTTNLFQLGEWVDWDV